MKNIKKSKRLVTVLVIAVLMLTGCQQDKQQAERENNLPIETITFQMTPSSNGVDDFLKTFDNDREEQNNGSFYNVVPEDIANNYGINIFKNDSTCYSALVYDNKTYTLGPYFGGYGVTSFAIADLNNDGKFELYFTCSWGSGIIRSQIGYFDSANKEIVIFDSASLSTDDDTVSIVINYWGELLLVADSDDALCVYSADYPINRKSFVDIEMSAGEKIASVVAENGEIFLVMEEDKLYKEYSAD